MTSVRSSIAVAVVFLVAMSQCTTQAKADALPPHVTVYETIVLMPHAETVHTGMAYHTKDACEQDAAKVNPKTNSGAKYACTPIVVLKESK